MRVFKVVLFLVLFVLLMSCLAATWPGRLVYWKSPAEIEALLLHELPLGTDREAVLQWLEEEGVRPFLNSGVDIAAGAESFFTRGRTLPATSSFTQVTLTSYAGQTMFTTAVEAFFAFDADHRLAAVLVRKTVNSF